MKNLIVEKMIDNKKVETTEFEKQKLFIEDRGVVVDVFVPKKETTSKKIKYILSTKPNIFKVKEDKLDDNGAVVERKIDRPVFVVEKMPLPEKAQSKAPLQNMFNELVEKVRAERKDINNIIFEHEFTFPGGVRVREKMLGEYGNKVFSAPNSIVKIYNKKVINTPKKPTTSDRHVGIEIELISMLDRTDLTDKICASGLGKNVQIKDDGSLQGSGEYRHTHEINFIAKEGEYKEKLQKLCTLLNEDCSVNKSCGLHVHVDMRNRNKDTAFNNLVKMQNIMFNMLPGARRENTYCKRVDDGATVASYKLGHHGAINASAITEHNTIEVRMHHGSIDFDDISNWVDILILGADAPKLTKKPVTSSGLRLMLSLNQCQVDYVTSCLAKYASESPTDGSEENDEDEAE
jgi:hypothetical protein